MSYRCSLACIVPPNLLKRIALQGDDAARATAIETLSLDHSIRLARSETAGRRTMGERSFGSLMSSAGKPKRVIYDQQHSTESVGRIVRVEGQRKIKDQTVNQAYDGLGATYKLYWDIYHRDSIDAAGMSMHGHVHYGTKYDNAFWDGQQMLFGDGDGVLFTSFTASLDVIGHELTHGVTQHEANLVYSGQSGALNESISDCFGSLVKQHARHQTAKEADWLIGAECVGAELKPALRSMKDPGHANQYDDQPADMDHYVKTTEDDGGVHTNSGIPNRAFYLAASQIGGHAWEKAGRIWYESLRDPRIRPNTGFRSFARATTRQAATIFGSTSAETAAIKNAWHEVKVL